MSRVRVRRPRLRAPRFDALRLRWRAAVVLAALLAATAVLGTAAIVLGWAEGAGDVVLGIGRGLVFAFLVVLIVRYVLLLWLGYLHHIEAQAPVDGEGAEPPVSVLVPVYNEEAVVEAAVRSLLEMDWPRLEVLVVDDGSTDGTYAAASRLAGDYGGVTVRVLRKANGGKASALNTGVAAARSPFVLCMDGDSRLAPETLRFAMRHFADPDVGAVAGNVKVVNRVNLWTRLQALEYIEGLNMARRAQGFLHAVNIVPGPVGVFRRDALLGVGGYDTDTFAEDADLTLKLLTGGWRIAYEDRAVAWTEAPESLHDLIKQRYRWTRGILQALRKRAAFVVAPKEGGVVWASLLFMLFEAIIWPAVNVLGNSLFAFAALSTGAASGVFYWWMLLLMLDIAAAAHTVGMEGEELELIPYAVAYRLFFITTIDVAKLFATVEEAFGVGMTWGKLDRVGRI